MLISANELKSNTLKTLFADIKPLPQKRGRPGKYNRHYMDVITAFDIETSTLPDREQAIMYIWQFQIGPDLTIIGRHWQQFFELLQEIKKYLRHNYMVIYVHNLSFEFQFLKGLYAFEPDEVFCMESRKVLKCDMFDCFEFRCSYLLTNMNLAMFTDQMHIENKKLSGFDYSKLRYPWTPLTDFEIQYCINDVQGLVQALYKFMAIEHDDVKTIPLTSTGFVRRDCREAMEQFNHKQLKALMPSIDLYRLLREAFRGGNTHANRWYAGDIIEHVKSVDRVSSYPDVMLNCEFPFTPFVHEPDGVNSLINMINHKHAVIFRCCFKDLDLKDRFKSGAPYLSRDKCRAIYNGQFDNGRILKADYLETTITDIDFKIIMNMYKWSDFDAFDIMSSDYHPLPEYLKDVIRKYYVNKTTLKGIPEEEDLYIKSKNKLNACYGMTAQDPVKDTVKLINNEYVLTDEPMEKLLTDSNKHAFLPYQIGVWVTAWARYRLQEVIDIAGYNFIYCDTDSVKYIGDIDITDYNKQRIKDSIKNKAYAIDRKGIMHYMGVFEPETGPDGYEQFKTLGAKKYVYTENGQLHITIAGVSKKSGAEELGNIENFKEGFTFTKAGGTESLFNDNIDQHIEIDGHQIHITDNVVIRPSTYTLGLTAEYMQILQGCIEIKYSDHDIFGYYKIKDH